MYQFASLGIRPAGITINIWSQLYLWVSDSDFGQNFGAEFSRGHSHPTMLVSILVKLR